MYAPDLVVEVRSPNDRPNNREWKLRADERAMHVHTKDGSRTFRAGDAFAHEAAPWLHSHLAEAFADLH